MNAEMQIQVSPDALAYCADSVRAADSDRFATLAFAPAARRPGLLALYAFNLEVAKSREVVSQQLIGSIRLQWWRDAIAEIYEGTPRRHQVVQPLAEAVHRFDLDRSTFEALLEAREADMADDPPADLDALAAYARDTAGGLVRLALQVLGARDAPAMAAGEAVGTAWGLVGLIRAAPFHARMRRCAMPADLLAEAGLAAHDVVERGGSPALSGVVRRVAEAAEARLAAGRALRREVPRRALPALLCGALASGHLVQLRRADWNPFDARVASPLPSRAWRLLAASVTGRY